MNIVGKLMGANLKIATGLVVIRVVVGEGMAELPLQRDAHTRAQIKSRAQLN